MLPVLPGGDGSGPGPVLGKQLLGTGSLGEYQGGLGVGGRVGEGGLKPKGFQGEGVAWR